MAIKNFPHDAAMSYDECRPDIAPGDLLLGSGTTPFSRMIRTVTESAWSHVGFVMPLSVINRIMVLESVESIGVRTVPLSKYLRDYNNSGQPYPGGLVIARHEDFPSDNEDVLREFARFAVDLFGYPYDNDEIARIAVRIMTRFLPWAKDLKRDKEYICSEYVYECYKSVDVTMPYSGGFITPADFANAREVRLQAVLRRGPSS